MSKTPSLFDQDGKPVRLGKQVADGGEGTVYEVVGADAFLAKLYLKPPDALKEAKLAHMVGVGASAPDLLKVAAWPTATLHEGAQKALRGFVMPRMSGAELHMLYGTVSRRRVFPNANWAFLLQVAVNCAAAFDTVHRAGAVIGDVNAKNLMASPRDATIRLIDCDSFQLCSNNQSFLCEVGVPEYTPPELQEKPFKGITRTTNHDCFGLAVLAFQLLFMGRHPFAGKYTGKGEMPQERAIKELRFAYGSLAATKQMSAPLGTLPLSLLPTTIATLFENAFSDAAIRGGRPSATDWLTALSSLTRQLATCGADPTHKFPANAGACPWCAIMALGGPVFFISTKLAIEFKCTPADLDGLLSDLHNVLAKGSEPRVGTSSLVASPTPLPSNVSKTRTLARVSRLAFGLGLGASGALATLAITARTTSAEVGSLVSAALTLSALIWLVWLQTWSVFGIERRRRNDAREIAQRQYENALATREAHSRELKETTAQAYGQGAQIRALYSALSVEYGTELATLTRNSETAHRKAFLECFEIVDAEIQGVGPAKKRSLVNCGIETAYDLLHDDGWSVSGIGPTLRERLMEWGRSKASSFRFDAAKGLPEGDRRALVARYRHRQTSLRGQLETLFKQTREASAQSSAALEEAVNKSTLAEINFKSADADLALVRGNAYWPIVGGLILVGVWLSGTAGFEYLTHDSSPTKAADTNLGTTPVSVDTFQEGTQVLAVGNGALRIVRYQPHDGQRQRIEISLEATRSDSRGTLKFPRAALQGSVAAHKGSLDLTTYQLTIESAHVTEGAQLDVSGQAIKKAIGRLPGSSIAMTVDSAGYVVKSSVEKASYSDDMALFALEEVQLAVSNALFVETPNALIGPGARWRVRRSHDGTQPYRDESMISAEALTPNVVTFERSATFFAPPSAGNAVSGTLTDHATLKVNDLIPTATGVYELSTRVGDVKSAASLSVSIRPL